jgi:hypothetical protein
MIHFSRDVASAETHTGQKNIITVEFLQHFLAKSLSAVMVG